MMPGYARERLLDCLAQDAYQFRPEKPFTLASGKESDEYLDCKLALCQSRAMVALGRMFMWSTHNEIVAVGGLTMGADPIAFAMVRESIGMGRSVRWFSVRKEPKGHGQQRLIEGGVQAGDRVAVVDDVVTSGGSTIRAIEACRASGLQIMQVVVLVDREQDNGMDNIRKVAGEGVPVTALFTKQEIKDRWTALVMRGEMKAAD